MNVVLPACYIFERLQKYSVPTIYHKQENHSVPLASGNRPSKIQRYVCISMKKMNFLTLKLKTTQTQQDTWFWVLQWVSIIDYRCQNFVEVLGPQETTALYGFDIQRFVP